MRGDGGSRPGSPRRLPRRELLRRLGAGVAGVAAGPVALAAGSITPIARAWAGPLPVRGRGELDEFIVRQMRLLHLPGLAATVVQGDQLLWSNGYGAANLERGTAVVPDTVMLLASVSKTVTGVALMQVVEDGLCDLDVDVNEYLPFSVRNPHFGSRPITPRMLLTHTSSIVDDAWLLSRLYYRGDAPIALGDFLREYLSPGGRFFSLWDNFTVSPPGTGFHYANYPVALAGYLVESISGVSFDQHCMERIFRPLGLGETSWRLADLHPAGIAMPYAYDLEAGRYVPWGFYGYPDYPDGLLRTSAVQLARFLMAFIGFGELDGARILRAETVEEMRREQIPDIFPGQGLIWYVVTGEDGRPLLGHNGGDLGVTTLMFFRPEDGLGVIVLSNGETLPTAVLDRLFAEWSEGAPPGLPPMPERRRASGPPSHLLSP